MAAENFVAALFLLILRLLIFKLWIQSSNKHPNPKLLSPLTSKHSTRFAHRFALFVPPIASPWIMNGIIRIVESVQSVWASIPQRRRCP